MIWPKKRTLILIYIFPLFSVKTGPVKTTLTNQQILMWNSHWTTYLETTTTDVDCGTKFAFSFKLLHYSKN